MWNPPHLIYNHSNHILSNLRATTSPELLIKICLECVYHNQHTVGWIVVAVVAAAAAGVVIENSEVQFLAPASSSSRNKIRKKLNQSKYQSNLLFFICFDVRKVLILK
jgi:hypothetical protein